MCIVHTSIAKCYMAGRVLTLSGAGSNLKVEGHNFSAGKNFFNVPFHFFVVPQGTIEKCRAQ